jgi:1-acyl-sn-glycerol-3-phosphate acyltransferase
MYHFFSDLVYAFFSTSLRILFLTFYKVKLKGSENFPNEGPLLIVSNHISEWDPPFLGCLLPWQVHWLAKTDLFQLGGGKMSGFFEILHCIPVDREKADRGVIRKVVHLLKEKRPVVIFAEGGTTIDESSVLGSHPELKEGAAMFAQLAKVPILPVILNGTLSLYTKKTWLSFRKHSLEIVVGPTFHLQSRNRSEASQEILQKLLLLKPQLTHQQIH